MEEHSFVKFVTGIDLVYLSNPKVASSSISYMLMMQSYLSQSDIGEHSELGKAITNRRPITKPYPKLPIFTFVREPIDRFVSYYNNKFVNAPTNGFELKHLDRLGFSPTMSIDEVVNHMLDIPVYKMEHHAQPQFRIVCKDNNPIADFVGKVEKIAHEWPVLAKLSGQNLQLGLFRNKTSNKSFNTEDISPSTLLNLYKYYEGDYLLFDYPLPNGIPEDYDQTAITHTPEKEVLQKIKIELDNRKEHLRRTAERLNNADSLRDYKKKMTERWRQFSVEEYRTCISSN
ncbi:sulfotransferase family 2 domain-containing protein [Paraglaciecola aquimarina]|uniref:Sulfotransferase family 2 domain-containing protein n=1 Tax=Paraglaciecola aquimarina TaxID=1235557 RepID=A0ABU3T0D0_9ALTE|nr:sulfotransferase family 2 domain-containing protein [Paraglaciecola aquimarina]MDU0355700.1 sulfotransferase family 2 domain-containing protein [Paraglaciecola aquimarina]